MYIHLEDWTHPVFISQIEEKSIPHRNKLLKIFSSCEDPRRFLVNRSGLTVFEVSGEPFSSDEIYSYKNRGKYKGEELEETLGSLELGTRGQEVLRSLFRFANTEIQLISNIMSHQVDGKWAFNHPFDEIDGIKPHKRFRGDKEAQIHIDVFHPSSLELVEEVIDINNTESILRYREGQLLRRTMSLEGNQSSSKER